MLTLVQFTTLDSIGEIYMPLARWGDTQDFINNTSRKATRGLPNHQTSFDPHINRYEPCKPILTP